MPTPSSRRSPPPPAWRGLRAAGRGALAADRRRHGPMVQLTGELGRAAGARARPVATRRAARHPPTSRRARDRRADDVRRAAPLRRSCARVPAGPRRGRGDHRRGADPEPRHGRREHRQRLARRRHPADPARRRCRDRRRLGTRRAARRRRRILAGVPADRAARRTSSCSPSASRSPRIARCGSGRSARAAHRPSARS